MNKSFLLLVLVLSAVICVSLAHDHDDHDDHDDKDKGKGRSRDIRFDGDPTDSKREIRFDAFSATSNVTTRFSFEIKLDGFPRFRVRFYSKNGTTTAGFAFRVGLRTLVEFFDNGTAPGLDPNDTVVSRFSLVGKKNAWSTWNKTDEFKNQTTNVTTRRYCITRNNAGASFYICVRITDGPAVDKDKVPLNPNRVKLDIGFNNYPYRFNGTRLALVAFVQSKSTANKADKTIAVGSDGELTWVSNFTNNGTYYPILTSQFFDLTDLTKGDSKPDDGDDDDDDKQEVVRALAFTFNTTDRLKNVLWDPEVGVTDAAALSSAFTLVISPMVLLLCALLQAFFF